MLLQPDVLSGLAELQRQDRLREAEIWRLTREARHGRAKFLGRLVHRLLAAAGEQLRIQARSTSATPDLSDLHR